MCQVFPESGSHKTELGGCPANTSQHYPVLVFLCKSITKRCFCLSVDSACSLGGSRLRVVLLGHSIRWCLPKCLCCLRGSQLKVGGSKIRYVVQKVQTTPAVPVWLSSYLFVGGSQLLLFLLGHGACVCLVNIYATWGAASGRVAYTKSKF